MGRPIFVRWLWMMAAALFIVLAVPAVSRAQDGQGQDGQGQDQGQGQQVPQFDMGTAAAAVALLAGGFTVLKARRRRRAG